MAEGIERLTPDKRNANKGTPRGRALLEDSLRRYGAGRSILADKHGQVIAGNKTLESAADIGLPVRFVETDGTELVVVRRTDLDLDADPAARELAYADNRVAQLDLDWDVAELLADRDAGLDLAAVGFSDDELAALLAGADDGTPGLTDPDAVPDSPAEPITRPGDLWTLGRHRLLCGDSTVAADVARLLDGAAIDLIVTSPPYNQALGAQSRPTGMHAENAWFHRLDTAYADALPEEEYQAWQVALLSLWFGFVRDGGACFYNHKHRYRDRRPLIPLDWLRRTPWQLRQEIVWDRRCGVAANAGMFVPGDERLYWLEKDGPHTWHGVGQNRTTVWPIAPQENDGHHVCPFPVELAAIPIACVSAPGDAVADPFGGSGTTLIAAEQAGRVAYLCEISPAYCDVIVARWEQFTGGQAVRDGA